MDIKTVGFNLHLYIIKVILYWPSFSTNHTKQTIYKILSGVKVTIGVILYVAIQCITVCESKDLKQMIENLITVFTNLNYLSKAISFMYNTKKIRQIFEDFKSDIYKERDEESKLIITDGMKRWRTIFYFYLSLCSVTVTSWGIFPIVHKTGLPFNYWYPFDVTTTPMYELAYTYEMFGMYIIAASHIALDAVMAGIMAFISTQIDVLNHTLRLMNTDKVIQNEMQLLRDQLFCISLHRRLQKLIFNLISN